MNGIEKTQPNIFHIHIDALEMSKELYDYVTKELRFYDSDFNGHPEGYVHFEPKRHMTLKLDTKEEYIEVWKKLESYTKAKDLKGYLEAEYIPIDDFIPYNEYRDIPVPFKIKRRRLTGEKNEEFRQTEIHLTMDKDKSHPDLLKKLLDSGLYGAYLPKDRGTFLVLTIQGFVKDIVQLCSVLKKYIEQSGGAYSCTIKEERAINYKLYGINETQLPEIAEEINYLT
ncbi:hypothetical protein IMCC3317_11230 [Kordia antarctica]|uniref:Uncharacterized protein n=1 Tax=Kordia antarctica TaxID=1218801 RepID=A0A7L4ZGK9_9FLAO|nr:hypothetical protein [Kordia antarctica]QHI35775.1 hypothetical protein IMCC3317_11230 [Kordia antarctica]